VELSKRGISSIVAVVSIIMITFAAVVIVVGYVVPLVRDSLDDSTECFGLEDYFQFDEDFGYNCYKYNVTTGEKLYGMSVGADAGGSGDDREVKGLKLTFVRAGSTDSVEIFEGDPKTSTEGGVRMVEIAKGTLEVPGPGETKTYVYNSTATFTEVKVLPILESERVCDVTDTISIRDVFCGDLVDFDL